MLQGDPETGARAKVLRRSMSPAEIALWLALRDLPGQLKFRRQHPAGPYVADFYCHAARLVIEVDGQTHDFGNRPARDSRRDRWFAQRGLETLRIAAREIFSDCDAVVRGIEAVAMGRLASRAGEDN